jgi:hypothetical protein
LSDEAKRAADLGIHVSEIMKKARAVILEIAAEQGPLTFFGYTATAEAGPKMRIMASGDWIDKDPAAATKLIRDRIETKLGAEDKPLIGEIVALPSSDTTITFLRKKHGPRMGENPIMDVYTAPDGEGVTHKAFMWICLPMS